MCVGMPGAQLQPASPVFVPEWTKMCVFLPYVRRNDAAMVASLDMNLREDLGANVASAGAGQDVAAWR